MRAGVQLGLLCLSLLISSLDGGQADTKHSLEQPTFFEFGTEDFPQFKVSENEQEQNRLSHDADIIPVNHRVKRQDNKKSTKRNKPRPGSLTLLTINLPTIRVKRQTDNARKKKPARTRPGSSSILARLPPPELESTEKPQIS